MNNKVIVKGADATNDRVIINGVDVFEELEKLLKLYKRVYDNVNAEVLKLFTYEQDEKTTLANIIRHLDDSKTVRQIRRLENE